METQLTGTSLVERIQRKCKQDGWYGSQLDSPKWMHVKDDDPRRSGFAYPLATEEQVQTTEATLGDPLPPTLKALYTHLANGGFGPGAGLRGIIGGYGTPAEPINEDTTDDTIVGYYVLHKARARFVNLAEYADQWRLRGTDRHPSLRLSSRLWPAGMLRICDLGCVQEMCVDRDGQLYLETPATHAEDGTRLEMVEENGVYHYQYILERLDCSLEDWLEAWLLDKDVALYAGNG